MNHGPPRLRFSSGFALVVRCVLGMVALASGFTGCLTVVQPHERWDNPVSVTSAVVCLVSTVGLVAVFNLSRERKL